MNYYNEHDPKAAAWIRELIAKKIIPEGVVDERDIQEIRPSDLAGFVQCHFFAGIGGWPHALTLAGWPSDRPVWTGSCPCQPFSTAGKGLGTSDERHLWPVFASLIREFQPPTVFGEQVASKAGREWLAGVFADLEGMGYSRAGADLCAAGVGAPHIRQRLYWVANSNGSRRGKSHTPIPGGPPEQFNGNSSNEGVGDSDLPGCEEQRGSHQLHQWEKREREERPDVLSGFWDDSELVRCRDGQTRRIKPGLAALGYGIPARLVRLRGYGNAIVPQVAATFVTAFCESCQDE